MHILTTGGAGYVGSHCARAFARAGHRVTVLDDLSEGNEAAVGDLALVRADIRDTRAVARALAESGADAVAHYAALVSVPASIGDPRAYWSVNVAGTQSLLDAMVETGVRRLVVSSTAAVYDHEAAMPLSEDAPTRPATPYGASKLAMEHLVRDYAQAYGLAATALRYFNAVGAEADGSHGEARRVESHVVPLLMEFALGKRRGFKVFGTDWPTPDGSCVRDFVSLDDLASAHVLALEAAEPGSFSIYNLGTGEGTSVLEMVAAAEAVVGRPLGVEAAPRRPGDPPVLVADATRIRETLGWRPERSGIEDVLRAAWAWHGARPDGYAEIGLRTGGDTR
ncbi:MAG: UDP-glucose 4-epimerase GalE [Paracoccaceae bacterium]